LSAPSTHEVAALERQALLGWLAFPWVSSGAIFYLRFIRKNSIKNLAEVRRRFREIVQSGRPTMVCANHLTMLDSFFLHWALGSQLDYLRSFRRFAWNVPAAENFKRSGPLSALTYLTKTVAIDRAGTPEHHGSVLGKLRHLLLEGQLITIFPEAGRSRTGRVEPAQVAYGVGQILRDVPDALVVCVYLRGDRQETWGEKPARGDAIEVDIEPLEPKSSASGMRASRDISRQIILKLKEMEERYFARRRASP
jgi:1-acyl-sn-glycerol-3-phosphate acyltransferase